MHQLVLEHVIDCDAATFWVHFFDRDLNAKLFVEGLGFRHYETVAQEETESTITRTTLVEPKLTVPGPVAKLMGSSFRYSETGTFDRAAGVWRWKLVPGTLPNKIRVEGRLTISKVGEKKVKRHITLDIEAKVLMIGGMIEDTFKKQLSEGWEKGAIVQNEWLKV